MRDESDGTIDVVAKSFFHCKRSGKILLSRYNWRDQAPPLESRDSPKNRLIDRTGLRSRGEIETKKFEVIALPPPSVPPRFVSSASSSNSKRSTSKCYAQVFFCDTRQRCTGDAPLGRVTLAHERHPLFTPLTLLPFFFRRTRNECNYSSSFFSKGKFVLFETRSSWLLRFLRFFHQTNETSFVIVR